MSDQLPQVNGMQDRLRKEMEELQLRERMEGVRHKLLVLSGKGGVGKSTVAANLAVSLAKAGRRVGLLDIDIHGPSIPKLLGLERYHLTASEDGLQPARFGNDLAVMSIEFVLAGEDTPVIWRGPLKYGAIRQFLKDVRWGCLDYLVVDSPPGTGDEPLSVAQLVGDSAGAIVVTTPQDLAIADVRRCVTFCSKLSVPIVGIVENMSGYVCPKCGERVNLFKINGGVDLAAEMDVPFLGKIPIDPDIVNSGDSGRPFVDTEMHTPAAGAFAGIVQRVLASVEQDPDPVNGAGSPSDRQWMTAPGTLETPGQTASTS